MPQQVTNWAGEALARRPDRVAQASACTPAPGRGRRAPAAAAALAVAALVFLPAGLLDADGGVFATTKHGDPVTGIQRLTGPDYPRGACVQCHSQHASAEGASTGTPNPYALFAANDNSLCGSAGCHAGTGVSHVYQGLATYNLSAHASDPAVVWPGPTPWPRRATDQGKCISCHDPHGNADAQGLVPSLGFAREENLCLSCHDGSPASTAIGYEVSKTYNHPVTSVAGRHDIAEGGDSTKFGAANRHAECADCHNVHDLQHAAVPLTPPDASPLLRGVSYIQVINGAAWTQPSYVFHAADEVTPIRYEYQLCFRCHSSWTTLPLTTPSGRTPTDKAREFNPNDLSYHPVEAAGRQTAMTWPPGNLIAPLTTTSIISCSDCHASDSPSSPRGPHGSTYRFLLKGSYTVAEHSTSYQPADFALCFLCHREAAVLDDQDSGTNTHFRFHRKHLQGAVGSQPYQPLCVSCHGNSHGSAQARLIDFSQESHLTSFVSWTSKEAGAGTGQCTLTCHGVRHDRRVY